jgi:hypothetical protein
MNATETTEPTREFAMALTIAGGWLVGWTGVLLFLALM